MGKLFDLDNQFFVFIEKIVDLLILNLLWIIFSLPIFTIGAATTALYYSVDKLAKNQEEYIIKEFCHSFKSNFIQATIMWLYMIIVFVVLAFDIYFFSNINTNIGIIGTGIFTFVLFLVVLGFLYVYPLLAKYNNDIKSTFKNAYKIAYANIITSISFMLIIGFSMYGFYVSISLMVILLACGVSFYTYISNRIIDEIIKKLQKNKRGQKA